MPKSAVHGCVQTLQGWDSDGSERSARWFVNFRIADNLGAKAQKGVLGPTSVAADCFRQGETRGANLEAPTDLGASLRAERLSIFETLA